jgi:FixJ family two-component response regulator
MGNRPSSAFVAIVDDDECMRTALDGLLRAAGLPVRTFESAEAFLESDHLRNVACLVADIRLPGKSGLDLQAALNATSARPPTIFITAHGDERIRLQALRAGAVEFLAKPFDYMVFLERVKAAWEQ